MIIDSATIVPESTQDTSTPIEATPDPVAVAVASAVATERDRWVNGLVRESRSRSWCAEFEAFMRRMEPDHIGDWYDSEGYSCRGMGRDGYDRNGYDRNGYDRAGYNTAGMDRDGRDRDGFDRNGRDREGRWQHHADPYAFDANGYDRDGRTGFGRRRDDLRLTRSEWDARALLTDVAFNRDRYGYTREDNDAHEYSYDALGNRLNRYGEQYN